MKEGALYGVLGEFATADLLLAAAREAHGRGYPVEAYSPFPVEGLAEAVGFTHNRVALFTFVGGLLGGAGTYLMQWYSAVLSYPINSGGRPLHSWPAFIPPTFAITILGAAIAAVVAMIAANGLPRLHHPLFALREFDLATRNRFFLCLRPGRQGLDVETARGFLAARKALKTWEVPQ